MSPPAAATYRDALAAGVPLRLAVHRPGPDGGFPVGLAPIPKSCCSLALAFRLQLHAVEISRHLIKKFGLRRFGRVEEIL